MSSTSKEANKPSAERYLNKLFADLYHLVNSFQLFLQRHSAIPRLPLSCVSPICTVSSLMNRLVISTARRMASAAPKTSTGIEHAEKARQVAGGKPDWTLYKCDDYLKFDKYSYAHAEITMNKARVPQPSYKKADELPKVRA
ncbi:hypothetical protein L3Y34_005591 [Caenorhabditis briggsae]|uniref:NADH dehydrogenase [ubiquinone] flavoprotein 3, mitochondrial n=2 Tax=Caenorhabditis briggsae TaxID=6238 RepID=A0AAE9AE43_CAEBR|nr:hypothetical protein L3Y34_005591 [Caenorhabditis briggsae]